VAAHVFKFAEADTVIRLDPDHGHDSFFTELVHAGAALVSEAMPLPLVLCGEGSPTVAARCVSIGVRAVRGDLGAIHVGVSINGLRRHRDVGFASVPTG
jgi:hypothetical protein